MQSLLIFIAEFQTATRQLLNNFELSGSGRSLWNLTKTIGTVTR
jgi:hypothetical protein